MVYYQILSTNSLMKCVEISLENLYVDIEAIFEIIFSTRPHGVVTWLVLILSCKHLRSFESSPLGVCTLRGVTI